MKYGMRKPNLKSRVKARTTGRAKRAIKRTYSPGYGKKGTGWIKNPKRAAYNKVYTKTTTGCLIPLIAIGGLLGLLIFILF